MIETPEEKRRALYGFASSEKFELKPPPPRPPKDAYPRIPRFWQLRGTRANTLMNYWALGWTVGGCFIGALMMQYGDSRIEKLMKRLRIPTTHEEFEAEQAIREIQCRERYLGIDTIISHDESEPGVREKLHQKTLDAALKVDLSRPGEVTMTV